MAEVISITANDYTQVSHDATSGHDITFLVTTDITFDTGQNCSIVDVTRHHNLNFPTDLPELHIHVEEGSGSNSIQISELITVKMANIHDPVSIKLVIKEGEENRKESLYQEDPDHIERPYNQRGFGY